jgi:hypothetical protein
MSENVSGNIEGPQAMPTVAPSSEADGVVDMKALFIDYTNGAPDVIHSYGELWGMQTEPPLINQTLGVNWVGARGMADEPLPEGQFNQEDSDGDYDDN